MHRPLSVARVTGILVTDAQVTRLVLLQPKMLLQISPTSLTHPVSDAQGTRATLAKQAAWGAQEGSHGRARLLQRRPKGNATGRTRSLSLMTQSTQ